MTHESDIKRLLDEKRGYKKEDVYGAAIVVLCVITGAAIVIGLVIHGIMKGAV